MHKKISQKKGFTLIELLVVISIISLLASVILSSVNSARAKARDARRFEDLVQIRNALALYASDNSGNYPVGHYFYLVGIPWSTLQTILLPYIKTLPLDPVNDASHYYYYTDSFSTGWMTSGAEGTCLGKAVLVAIATESGKTRRDCTLNAAAEQYPNEIVMQIN